MGARLSGGAVVLAAGRSARFGSDKRHHRLSTGRTLLETTLASYQRVFDEIYLVLRPGDETWAHRVTGVRRVYAAASYLGMGHSLAAGVQAARHLDFLFIALADMPHIQAATLRRLEAALADPLTIAQPVYGGMPGHPVGFGNVYFHELERVTGDAGAREVVRAHRDRCVRIDVDDAGVLKDIDVPPD